jgi:hypothetical protein
VNKNDYDAEPLSHWVCAWREDVLSSRKDCCPLIMAGLTDSKSFPVSCLIREGIALFRPIHKPWLVFKTLVLR